MPLIHRSRDLRTHTPPRRDGARCTQSHGWPGRSAPLLRRFQATHLNADGTLGFHSDTAPAHPAIEACFGALSGQSRVKTPNGLRAVADLGPGEQIETSLGAKTLSWVGSMEHVASAGLVRVTPGAFGPGHPEQDLVLAPNALLHGPQGWENSGALVNGDTLLDIHPPRAVTLFQLGFGAACAFNVDGVWVRASAPDQANLPPAMHAALMRFFPHLHGHPEPVAQSA